MTSPSGRANTDGDVERSRPAPEFSSGGRANPVRERWWLAAVLAIAALLRIWMLIADHGTTLDSDEAVIGLMARHIWRRGELPVFFYGQEYMGALEAYLSAIAFAIFGATTWTLKGVMVVLDLIAVLSFGWLGTELWDRRTGLAAAAFAAVPPVFLAIYGLKARGGYVETLIFGNLLLAGWARLTREEDRVRGLALGFALGGVAGLAFWTHNLIAVYFPAAAVIGLAGIRRDRLVPVVSSALLGAVVGGLPFWVRNLATGFRSFGNLAWVDGAQALRQAGGFLTQAAPVVLGSRGPWAASDVAPGATAIVAGLHVAAAAVYVRRARSERAGVGALRTVARLAPWLVAAVATAAFAWSTYGAEVREPRYLVPLYSALALDFGVAVTSRRSAPWRLGPILGALLLLVHLLGIVRQDPSLMLGISAGQRVARNNADLVRMLDKLGIHSVYTDYWVAYRLAFESGERIQTSPYGHVVVERDHDMSAAVARDENPAFVLLGDAATGFRGALMARGLKFRERETGPYRVFYRVQNLEEVRGWRYPFS